MFKLVVSRLVKGKGTEIQGSLGEGTPVKGREKFRERIFKLSFEKNLITWRTSPFTSLVVI
jgi:hypothetical protein